MFRYMKRTSIFLVCYLYAAVPPQINLGIDSIEKNKDGSYDIHVYMLNQVPLAGFQLDLLPPGLLEIESIHGGRGEATGFNMSAGKKGTMLGFSFSGAAIEPSKSDNPTENLFFTLNVKLIKEVPNEPVNIGFTVIMAGKSGEKVETEMVEYTYDFFHKVK